MSSLLLGGLTSGTIELKPADVAGTNVINVPATTGTMITTGDTGSVTNAMLAGSISNDKLANSTITIGGQSVALGGSIAAVGGGSTGAVFDVVRLIDNERGLTGTLKATNFTVRTDSNNGFSTGLSRFTPNVAGYYFISARVTNSFGFGVTVYPAIMVYKNGTEVFSSRIGGSNITLSQDLDISGYVLMNGSTDYLELYMYANTPSGQLTSIWPRIQWHGHMVRAA